MIGERIRQLRGKEPQGPFGVKFGISRNTVMRYESSEREPDAGFIVALCQAYNVSANWLLLGQDEKKPIDGTPISSCDNPSSPSAPNATLGEHVDLLAKIHNSGNTILIKAIDANLHAFSEAIDNKAMAQKAIEMMEEMNKRILVMESEIQRLNRENLRLDMEAEEQSLEKKVA